MGGDLEPSHLDLNMLSDPHAANIVLAADVPKTLVSRREMTLVRDSSELWSGRIGS